MKIAHMSDLHFCAKNLRESDATFGFAVKQAIEANVDAAIITGDSTDYALDAHDPSLLRLAFHLKTLADHCPVLMLQGTFSHEPPGLLRMFQMIGARHRIDIAEHIGMIRFDKKLGFSTARDVQSCLGADLVVTAFPTVNRADLVSMQRGADDGAEIGERFLQLMRNFGRANRHLYEQGVPTLVIGHGTVVDCQTEHGVPMAGQDHEFGVGALFACEADAVALGHIHKHQVWVNDFGKKDERSQIIGYAGSIGRFHYGEEGDKYFLLWDIVPGNPSFEAVATPSRRNVELHFDGPPDMDAIRAAQCDGAFVRVTYCVDEEHRQSVDREAIKAALASAAEVQIEGKTLLVERQRCAGISTANSVEDKLSRWAEVTSTPVEPLRQRLQALQARSADEVSEAVKKHYSERYEAILRVTSAPAETATEEEEALM